VSFLSDLDIHLRHISGQTTSDKAKKAAPPPKGPPCEDFEKGALTLELPPEPHQTDQAGADKKQGGGFGDG